MKTEEERDKEELEFLESLYPGGYVPSRWKKIEQRKEELKERLNHSLFTKSKSEGRG